MTIATEITEYLESKGADLVGFGELADLPKDVRHVFPLGISIAVALDPEIISQIHTGPTKQYHKEYERANHLLDSLARDAAEWLEQHGCNAKAFAATNEGVDPKTHSTCLPHKTVATRAGVGWIGKCALLVTEAYGSAIRLTKVLTDAKLPIASPVTESQCGDCSACVEACPGHAPTGKGWHIDSPRNAFFDAFACRKKARQLALERTGIEESFCGICIAVCPWTQKYLSKSTQPCAPPDPQRPPAFSGR